MLANPALPLPCPSPAPPLPLPCPSPAPPLVPTSGNVSESEVEDEESHVTLPQDMPGRGNIQAEQSAVKLTEVPHVTHLTPHVTHLTPHAAHPRTHYHTTLKCECGHPQSPQLGPRMTLQLVKIEEGFCEGEVLHHEFSEWVM